MKILVIASVLFFSSCTQNTAANHENDNYVNGNEFKSENDSLKNDTCNIYFEFRSLKGNLINKQVEQIANVFDFPIKDQGVLAFINSHDLESNQQIEISGLDDFRNNFDKIFPSKFLSLLKKVTHTTNYDERYQEVDWESLYDNQNMLFERNKLLYKIDKDTVVLRFIMETSDETGNYETVVEYFFRLNDCKLKFEKSIIAG